MKPIYEPKGKAKEYGDLAVNIYTGCPHRCIYCFAPLVKHCNREKFHSVVEPRKNIVETVKRQLDKEQITGKMIHLCFTTDPYVAEIDTTPTRKIIKAIKASGNNVQILTKGGKLAERDFDLLDKNDWFGISISGRTYTVYKMHDNKGTDMFEPNAAPFHERLPTLENAYKQGIKTWVSCEPVLNTDYIYNLIKGKWDIDLFRIGKLNYSGIDPKLKEIHDGIDWAAFGAECERLCKEHGRNYVIKDGLREIMEKNTLSLAAK